MAKHISEELNMPFGTVDRHIRILLKKKKIERRGSKKTGGYYVL
jgi:ATP-dependent DNA helicase RecG